MRLSAVLAAAGLLPSLLCGSASALRPTHPRELTHRAEPRLSLHHAAARADHRHTAHARTTALHAPHTTRRHQAQLVSTKRDRSGSNRRERRARTRAARQEISTRTTRAPQIAQPAHLERLVDQHAPKPALSSSGMRAGNRPQLPDIAEAVTQPIALPQLYDQRGRLLMPAALVGSHEVLLHQNAMADQDGLGRIQNDADLDAMRERGMLLSVPVSQGLAIDQRLPMNRRVVRPWTANFLHDLSRDYYQRFHAPLQVTSAVRTVEFQQKLIHHNGNAAPADGDTASPHLTGQAVDLGKRGMSLSEIAWMRGYLLPLIQSGKIDVEEEFRQSCFHISVYRRYASPAADHYSVASRGTTSSLATVLP